MIRVVRVVWVVLVVLVTLMVPVLLVVLFVSVVVVLVVVVVVVVVQRGASHWHAANGPICAHKPRRQRKQRDPEPDLPRLE